MNSVCVCTYVYGGLVPLFLFFWLVDCEDIWELSSLEEQVILTKS